MVLIRSGGIHSCVGYLLYGDCLTVVNHESVNVTLGIMIGHNITTDVPTKSAR